MSLLPPGRGRAAGILAAGALLASLAACSPGGDGRVQLDFFQFKGEAAEDFRQIVADFEAENPDIDVVINQVPDADTAIRTLLVKNKVPDVITLNGSGNFGDLAEAGVFWDFTGDPLVDQMNPSIMEILDDLGTYEGDEINALPMASNALGVIYNRQVFEEQGLEVPTTWDELIEVCEALRAAGIDPFYATVADAWTTLEPFLALGPQLQPDDFFERLRDQGTDVGPDSEVSFENDYRETFEKMRTLYQDYAQSGYRAANYDDGNAAFARGESAMYIQGIWALNPILTNDPDIDLGVFPLPATNDPSETRLVSGVDVALTIGRDTQHPEEARRFVEYLVSPEVLQRYNESQLAFSPLADAEPPSAEPLQELLPYFDDGRIVGFVDHQIPASVPLQPTLQQFFLDYDIDRALRELDQEWSKVAARTTVPEGAGR